MIGTRSRPLDIPKALACATMSTRRSTRFLALGALVALALGLVACSSDDGETAADRVCQARADLQASIQDVSEELSNANFGAAREKFDEVGKAFDQLGEAVRELAGEQREELQPALDALRKAINDLTNADSFGAAGAAIDQIGGSLNAVVSGIDTELDCDDART